MALKAEDIGKRSLISKCNSEKNRHEEGFSLIVMCQFKIIQIEQQLA